MLTADPNALQDVTEAIRATLQNVNRIVADNQESVKSSLKNLETFTSALARNSEKIDNVMLKVDGVMGKADSLMLGLNTIAGGAAGGELNLMVKSIRELADDFDKRSGALIADGRRTLGRHQPRREQFRPQPEPGDLRRQQQRRAGRGSAPSQRRRRGLRRPGRPRRQPPRRAGRSGSRSRRTYFPPANSFTSRYRYSLPLKNDLTSTRSSRPWMRFSPMSLAMPEWP